MKLREYFLINELNQRYELRNVRQNTIMSDPEGLGYEKNMTYVRVGNTYKLDHSELAQGTITAEMSFLDYDTYQQFVDFIETSSDLRLIYRPLDTEYLRDVDFQGIIGITKSYNIMQCSITLNCKSLYYTEDHQEFVAREVEGESRWPLLFPFEFNEYSKITFDYFNFGHTEGAILAEVFGYTQQPQIELLVDGNVIHSVIFDIVIQEGEKLLYSAKDGDNYVMLEDKNGNQTNVADCLRLECDNFFKVPRGRSSIRITSATGVMNKTVFRILTAYKVV